MTLNYQSVDDLYAIAQAAMEECSDGPVTNLLLAYEVDAGAVESSFVAAYSKEAREWMAEAVPPRLPFTHGQYFHGREGQEYVANQLRRNGSRRALLSLVAMDDLLKAQPDGPLPSFLVLQFALDDETLSLTAYFRALEVSTFFRSNLAEICLHAKWVRDQFPRVAALRIAVLAFEAYVDNGFSLAIPAIDRQAPGQVALTAQAGNIDDVCAWLEEKAGAHANFVSTGLEELQAGLRQWDACPSGATDRLGHAIEVVKGLRELRQAHTEGPQLDEARDALRNDLQSVIRELRASA